MTAVTWPGDGRTGRHPRPRPREHRTPPSRPVERGTTACPECGTDYGTPTAAALCCTD